MRIKVLMTDKAMGRAAMDQRERMLSAAVSPGVAISVDCIKKGPDELDCHTDEAFAAPELVKMAIQAEKDGFDAIVIYCFSDVGLDACRENVRVPVIAPGETALAVAQTLCSRFVAITGAGWNIPRTYRRMMRSAIAREKMAAVLALDIPSAEMRVDPNAMLKEFLQGVRGHESVWFATGSELVDYCMQAPDAFVSLREQAKASL
ncbi:aspartate/glutamate racemase family protein [uncultured Dysosmobacter sp.]|uniref:aspartate/glutamate racemase family protein n=1 Tax=uncultured Dysosmobacter sp. TaxID=2591384 RepID=UPI002616079E|nr:aspartate/glutamate racemase family protein [uncultured Dysosmobacter sp.]